MDTPDITALRAELNGRKGQWAAIARAGEFDYSWVVRFSRGAIAEPRLSKLQRLRTAMDNTPQPPPTTAEGRAAA
jgi:hypothetical protein